jgi:hypothetical protein
MAKRGKKREAPPPPPVPRDKTPWLLAALTALLLVPFAGKAFHIDDPLFLWSAQQIVNDPFDFYGSKVNWFGTEQPMADVMQNPPLASFYLALASRFSGWNEVGLHLAMLLFAIATVVGTWRLSRSFNAALFVLAAPVFLVSATNVMCDVMMVALYVWSVALWVDDAAKRWWIAAILAAAAGLTKYFAVSLVPLFLLYALLKKRPFERWLPPLLLPVAVLAIYDLATARMYGKGLLRAAMFYASTAKVQPPPFADRVLHLLLFTGGCALFVVVAALLSRYLRIALVVALIIGGVWAWAAGGDVPVQKALFVAAALVALTFAALDVWKRRDAESILLAAWIAGTLLFAGYFNWTLNGRALLPMIPPLAIIVARQLASESVRSSWITAAAVIGIIASILVAWGDLRLANAGREATRTVYSRYGSDGHTIWFEGHWGFQYYMQNLGAHPLDFNQTVHREDLLVIPQNSVNPFEQTPPHRVLEPIVIPLGLPASTMQSARGAGFYSDLKGPMPFVFGTAAQEEYSVLRLGR